MPLSCTTILFGSKLMTPSALIAPGTASFVGPVVMVVTLPFDFTVGTSFIVALSLNPEGGVGCDPGAIDREDDTCVKMGPGVFMGAGVGVRMGVSGIVCMEDCREEKTRLATMAASLAALAAAAAMVSASPLSTVVAAGKALTSTLFAAAEAASSAVAAIADAADFMIRVAVGRRCTAAATVWAAIEAA